DVPTDGRCGGARRTIQHRSGPGAVRAHDAQSGPVGRRENSEASDGQADDERGKPRPSGGVARTGVGHRLGLQPPAWRPVSTRLLWAYWFYGHSNLDRSFFAKLLDFPLESSSSRWPRKHSAIEIGRASCRERV